MTMTQATAQTINPGAATATANLPAEAPKPANLPAEAPKPIYAPSVDSQAYELVIRKAKALSNSSLVPDAYRGPNGIANCIIAQNMADRIGADVLMVIQNLDVVHGRPGFRSSFIIATVNVSKRFSPLRFEWFNAPKPGERPSPNWGCRAYATSREDGKECVGMTITWDIVTKEGWLGRKGSKWQTMPEQMFMYRTASFWARVFCPELTLGMKSSEELSDMDESEPNDGLPMAVTQKPDENGRRPPLTSGSLYDDEPETAPTAPITTTATASDDADKGVGD